MIFFDNAKIAPLFTAVLLLTAAGDIFAQQISSSPKPPTTPITAHIDPPASTRADDMQGPFFMVDESPIQVVKIYESLTGKTSIMSAQIPDVKINFTSQKLSREDAIRALKSVLAVNGIAISPLGDKFFKVSPATAMSGQAPEFITGRADEIKPSQNFYSKIFRLKYVDVDTFKDSLTPFISPKEVANLTVFSRNNSFMLTDTLGNIQRVEMVLDRLDKPTEIAEDVTFITLKNVSAEDMKRRIVAMQSELLKKYFNKSTIEADERTNQLIIISPRDSSKIIRAFVEKLDIDSQPITRSQVFYIKHGESKDVATVLNQIVKGQQSAVKANNQQKVNTTNRQNINNRISNAQARANAARTNSAAVQRPTNLTPDLSGASLQFSEYITIVADERSNSIVCYGTPGDLKQISDIIEEVDIVLAQVKLDVIITEVTLSDKQVSGLSTFGLNYSLAQSTASTGASIPKGWSGNTATWKLNDTDSMSAFTITANEQGFNSVFNVARQNSGVKVLSAPTIVTTHNKEAKVNVSKRYPLLQSVTSTYTSSTPYTTSSVNWEDIGIILEVTPLIGDNGVVQMKIKQTVETIIDYTTVDTTTQPIIGKREAESFVSAKAGEMIILAGMQQINLNKTDGSVWLLGDIPLIGELFKPDRTLEERTELIIFIRPKLVKSESYANALKDHTFDTSPAKKEIKNFLEGGKFYKNNIRNSVDETIVERIRKREYRPNVDYFDADETQIKNEPDSVEQNTDSEKKEPTKPENKISTKQQSAK